MTAGVRSQETGVRSLPRFTWSRAASRSPFCCWSLYSRSAIRDPARNATHGVAGGPRSTIAFTLIELLTVLAIIMVLAGLIVAGSKYAMTKAGRSRAEAEIAAMENALENYKNDYGVYPPSTTTRFTSPVWGAAGSAEIKNSNALYAALTGGTKVYMTFKPNQIIKDPTLSIYYIVDPFGSPYNYYCVSGGTGQKNPVTFDLWPYGPDGMHGNNGTVDYELDNITNWKQ